MSSVLGVTKDLMWSKFKLMNLILLFNLIGISVILISGILKQKWILVEIACLVYFVGVILLVDFNERVISNNRYRLVPISETKLYLSNLITTCLAYGYLGIMATGTFMASAYLQMKSDLLVSFMTYTDMRWELFIEDAIIMVLAIILIWTGSTLVHLLLDFVSNFFDVKNRRIISIVVKLLILGLSAAIIFLTLINMTMIGLNRYMEIRNDAFLKFCLIEIFGIILTSVGNVYLLQNYFETSR